ncbi:hypothetical protein ACFYTQ_04070 [Nocardia sp. NPDC004068]|uniref:hypothetical protein n=1 Tax=Nocardia sp. NPDC004068 TaxID=3364303 RepID=UPI0036A80FBA
MSDQDIANAAAGHLGVDFAAAPGIDVEIQREVRRQSGTGWTFEDRRGRSSTVSTHDDPPPAPPYTPPPPDAVFALTVDHWCTDDEITALLNYAPFDGTLMRDRWDPTCPSEFYRGYITALAGLVQSVSADQPLDRYRSIVTTIDDILKSWTGTPDQRSGAAFAMTNAWQYSESGATVPQIVPFLRGEIACLAECFRTARWHGH